MSWQTRTKAKRSDAPVVWVAYTPWTGDLNNGLALAHALGGRVRLVDIGENGDNLVKWERVAEYHPKTLREIGDFPVTNDVLPDILIDSTRSDVAHGMAALRKQGYPTRLFGRTLDVDRVMKVRMTLPDFTVRPDEGMEADLVIGYNHQLFPQSSMGKALSHVAYHASVPPRPLRSTGKAFLPKPLAETLTCHPVHAVVIGERCDTDKDLSREDAQRLGRMLAEIVERDGGSVVLTTSPRTSDSAGIIGLIQQQLPPDTPFYAHDYQKPSRNPYATLLKAADRVIVTDDSMSMMADATQGTTPCFIFARADETSYPYDPRKPHRFIPGAEYAAALFRDGAAFPLADLLEGKVVEPRPLENPARAMAAQVLETWQKRCSLRASSGVSAAMT